MVEHADIWLPWIPHIRKDIRVLAVNRRGYEGSSPPHKSTRVTATTQETFGRYFVDFLGFIRYAIEQLGVHPKDVKTQTGGIVLLGWSKGCMCPMALLSLLPALPDETRVPWHIPISLESFQSLIDTHVRSVILYEPPQDLVGLPGTRTYRELSGLTQDTLADGLAGWLRATVPADKASLLDAAHERDYLAEDFGTWYGEDQSDCAQVAHKAFDTVPPGVGTGILFCTGPNALHSCIASSAWITAYLASQPNTMSKRIHVGDHYLMATDPEIFNDSICEFVDALRVE